MLLINKLDESVRKSIINEQQEQMKSLECNTSSSIENGILILVGCTSNGSEIKLTVDPNNVYDDVIYQLRSICNSGEYVRQNHNSFHIMNQGESRLVVTVPNDMLKIEEEIEVKEEEVKEEMTEYKLATASKTVHIVDVDGISTICGTRAKLNKVSIHTETTCKNCLKLAGIEVKEEVKAEVKEETQYPEPEEAYYILCDENNQPIRKNNKILKHYIYNNLKKAKESMNYLSGKGIESKMMILEPSEDNTMLFVLHHTDGILVRDNRLVKYYYYMDIKYANKMSEKFNEEFNGLGVYPKGYSVTHII